MRTLPFLLVTLVSGAIAGAILGIINLALVEPYIEKAIQIETQNDIKEGQNVNTDEMADYRIWQKNGEIIGAIVYGISVSALFGIVFAYSRNSLPGNNVIAKAIFLASIMCFVLFIVPSLKYPSNPPAVGDPDTIYYRQALFLAFLVISGVSALGATVIFKKINQTVPRKTAVTCAIYGAIIILSYVAMPSNPDKISISIDLVEIFRLVSTATIVMFWLILGGIFGTLWNKFRPYNLEKITAF